tara:strand:+ start:46 stop:339 length:294 start_codon:yes stop_codon:yes gene_type:complete
MSKTAEDNTLIDIDDTKTPITLEEQNQYLERYVWRSFCFQIDRRVLLFFSQFSIGIMVIGFSLFQLNKKDTCEHQQLYTGLLTMMVGIFLPSPRLNR